jgi:hypothetical protein
MSTSRCVRHHVQGSPGHRRVAQQQPESPMQSDRCQPPAAMRDCHIHYECQVHTSQRKLEAYLLVLQCLPSPLTRCLRAQVAHVVHSMLSLTDVLLELFGLPATVRPSLQQSKSRGVDFTKGSKTLAIGETSRIHADDALGLPVDVLSQLALLVQHFNLCLYRLLALQRGLHGTCLERQRDARASKIVAAVQIVNFWQKSYRQRRIWDNT